MIIGLKYYPDKIELARKLQNEVDFFEVMAKQDERNNVEAFGKLKAPVKIVHCEHTTFGVNISDRDKHDFNMRSVRFAQEMADKFGSKYIIIHPGTKLNEKCSLENIIEFYKELDDKRILVENLPYIGNFKGMRVETFGRLPEEIKKIMRLGGVGFCYDFEHSWTVASVLKKDIKEFAKEFIRLGPSMYHFADSIVGRETDSHLNFGDGNADVSFFKSLIPKDAIVTLETAPIYEKQFRDIMFMRE